MAAFMHQLNLSNNPASLSSPCSPFNPAPLNITTVTSCPATSTEHTSYPSEEEMRGSTPAPSSVRYVPMVSEGDDCGMYPVIELVEVSDLVFDVVMSSAQCYDISHTHILSPLLSSHTAYACGRLTPPKTAGSPRELLPHMMGGSSITEGLDLATTTTHTFSHHPVHSR